MNPAPYAQPSRKRKIAASIGVALVGLLFCAVELLIVRSYIDSSRMTRQFTSTVQSTTFLANVQRQFFLYQRALLDSPVAEWRGGEVVKQRSMLNRQIDLLGRTRHSKRFQDQYGTLTYKLISINGLVRDPSLISEDGRVVKKVLRRRLSQAERQIKEAFDLEESLLFSTVGQAVHGRESSQRSLVALAGIVFLVAALLATIWNRSVRSKLRASYRALLSEMDQRRSLEDKLTHQAFHDPLTGLANRDLFTNDLEKALGRTQRKPGSVGILYIDLDHFKGVNDTLGHAAGDALLKETATRIREVIRPTDTAARLGGDEFAIVIDDLENAEQASIVAKRVLASFEAISIKAGLSIQASIGVAVSDDNARSVDDLLRNADLAMYEAKQTGKNGYCVFDPEMNARVLDTRTLETELRQAIDNDRLLLHFQPIVSLADSAPVGFEALVRWNHPSRGVLPPGAFIGIAEERGLIVDLDAWVLKESCRQLARWKKTDPAFGSLYVSVNVSGAHFEDPGLVRTVNEALSTSGLEPKDLRLELTESTLMRDTDAAGATLDSLKRLGVQLSLDDFGTGYSSLSYLRSFPLDTLKIDRSFIADVTRGPEESALTKAIIRIGQTLRLEVVAEGIEHPDQVAELKRLGCRIGQGFLFSKPLPPEAIEKMITGQPDDDRSGTELGRADRQEQRVLVGLNASPMRSAHAAMG